MRPPPRRVRSRKPTVHRRLPPRPGRRLPSRRECPSAHAQIMRAWAMGPVILGPRSRYISEMRARWLVLVCMCGALVGVVPALANRPAAGVSTVATGTVGTATVVTGTVIGTPGSPPVCGSAPASAAIRATRAKPAKHHHRRHHSHSKRHKRHGALHDTKRVRMPRVPVKPLPASSPAMVACPPPCTVSATGTPTNTTAPSCPPPCPPPCTTGEACPMIACPNGPPSPPPPCPVCNRESPCYPCREPPASG